MRQFVLPGLNDRVPCVFGRWLSWHSPRWWPVLPSPFHNDVEHLNFPAWHFHIDGRYLTDAQNKMALGRVFGMVRNDTQVFHPMYHTPLTQFLIPQPCGRYTERTAGGVTAYCRTILLPQFRPMPPPPNYSQYRSFRDLFNAYPNPVAVDGRCPHKGADLTGLPCNDDGTVTCPLHGLRVRV